LFGDTMKVVAEADSVATAIAAIQEHHPQLVFLDILLPDGLGFSVMEAFDRPDFGVIFVTGFSEYAIRAIRYGAIDYLVKPIAINELSDAVHRALAYFRFLGETAPEIVSQRLVAAIAQRQAFAPQHNQMGLADKLSLPTSKGSRIVSAQDVLYCEAQSNYTQFYFTDASKMLIARTMGHFEPSLVQHGFARIHRSFIINPHHVRETIRSHKAMSVMMTNSTELPVSSSYQDDLLKVLP
jgi:two-component system, LytTR family, response regulator